MPIAAIFAFLRSPLAKYLGIGLGVLIILAGAYFKGSSAGHKAEKRKWEAEVAQLNRDLVTCHDNGFRLQSSLDAQNAAVAALSAEGSRRSAEAAKAVQQAQRAAVTASKKAAQVLAARAGADACKSADELILGSLP